MLVRVTSPVLGANPGDLIELDPEDLDEAAKYLAGGHLVPVDETPDDVVLGVVDPSPVLTETVPVEQLPGLVDSLSGGEVDALLREQGLPTTGRVGARRARLLEALLPEG